MDHNVKALVLAAGKGTRLQTEGIDLPKVMRQADGHPLLYYVLRGLSFLPGYLSVLCSSGAAHGVTLSNLKYPLTDYNMTSSFPIGVSNEFLPDQPAAVSVKDGCLLLVWEDKGDFYLRLPKLWTRNEAL